jgi:hypothetical protein
VDAGILDVALSLGGEFLPKIGRVLVFDVFHNGIPTRNCQFYSNNLVGGSGLPSVIVDQVSISRGVDNIEPQSYTILFNDYALVSCCPLRIVLPLTM